MYELCIEDNFAGAHNLRNYHGKCERLHGHNWKVQVCLQGEKLEQTGLLVDFSWLKKKLKLTLNLLDHRYLNQNRFFKTNNPSAENIARFIAEKVKFSLRKSNVKLKSVSVWESETSLAIYYPPE